MRAPDRVALLVAIALLLAVGRALQAQRREGLMGDLLKDIADLQKDRRPGKAMPAEAYTWRPAPGVGSTGEGSRTCPHRRRASKLRRDPCRFSGFWTTSSHAARGPVKSG